MASISDMPEESLAATIDASEIIEQPPVEKIGVKVQFCGTDYTVGVKPNGNIGELKRETHELAGLITKRQKHMDADDNELKDEHLIASLQNPPKTELISLNKKIATDIYRKHFRADKPKCTVKPTKNRVEDFDTSKTRFYTGKYQVGSMVMDCLIRYYKSGDNANLLRSIQLMRGWNHPNLMVMETLYKLDNNTVPRLVLSSTVNGSLQGHFNSSISKNEDVILKADGSFTSFFTKIIIALCDLLDQMVKKILCPENLSKDNLYLKRVANDELQLKVLFDNVARLNGLSEKQQLARLCNNLKDICTPHGSVHKDTGTQEFIKFLGNQAVKFIGENLAATASNYPVNWTTEQKSKYLMDLIPSSADIRKDVNNCGIVWPKGEDGAVMCQQLRDLKKEVDAENNKIKVDNKKIEEEEIKPLKEEKMKINSEENDAEIRKEMLAANEEKMAQATGKLRAEILWNYDTKYGHDLVRLARNLWKHYDTYPRSIKRLFGTKEGTLAALEKWCPGVWFLMYNAVGLGF